MTGFRRMLIILFLILPSLCLFAQVDDDLQIYRIAEQLFANKEFGKAAQIFEDLSRRHPTNQLYFDRWWNSLFEAGEFEATHALLQRRYETTNESMLLVGMTRCSIFLGKLSRAETEWKQVLIVTKQNKSVARSIGQTLLQAKYYREAELFYFSFRTENNPLEFSPELLNLYTQTLNYEALATEWIKLLTLLDQQEILIESRLTQFNPDSVAASRLLKIFEQRPTSVKSGFYKIKAHLYLLTNRLTEAYDYFMIYDNYMKASGVLSTYEFINRISFQFPDHPLIIPIMEMYLKETGGKYKSGHPLDQRYIKILSQKDTVSIRQLGIIDSIRKVYEKTQLYYVYLDIYFEALLKTSLSETIKIESISELNKTNRSQSSIYWNWVVNILNKNKSGLQVSLKTPSFKKKYPQEFILTSLILGVSIDSLRDDLLEFAKGFTEKYTPYVLFYLIESVPVPNISFSEFESVAYGFLYMSIYQWKMAEGQLSESYEIVKDVELKSIIQIEKVKLYLRQRNDQKLKDVGNQLVGQEVLPSRSSESLWLIGDYYFRKKEYDQSKSFLEHLIRKYPGSPYIPFARELLSEIRKISAS